MPTEWQALTQALAIQHVIKGDSFLDPGIFVLMGVTENKWVETVRPRLQAVRSAKKEINKVLG